MDWTRIFSRLLRKKRDPANPSAGIDNMLARLILVFLLLTVCIGAAGYLYYSEQQRHTVKDIEDELSAIADLKISQLVQWRNERIADGQSITRTKFIGTRVDQFLKGPAAADGVERDIRDWMLSLQEVYAFRGILLVDIRGKVRLTLDNNEWEIGPHGWGMIRQALRERHTVLSDFHKAGIVNYPHLDLAVPLFLEKGRRSLPLGALLIRIDPGQFLYPLIQSWPTASKTAETLLLRREGSDVLFLNELRHTQNTALSLRISLAEKPQLAVLLDRGERAIIKIADYRNVPVLAVIQPVPATPWFLVSKVDIREIYAPLRERTQLLAVVMLVLIVSSGLSLGFWWRQKSAEYARKQLEAEAQSRALSEQYNNISKYANDIILLSDGRGAIAEANDRAIITYGYSREELHRLSITDLLPVENRDEVAGQMRQVKNQNGFLFETVHRKKDGTLFPVEVSSRIIGEGGGKFYQSIIRDITERKRAEQKLKHVTRLYALLGEVNQTIVRVDDRDKLFRDICRIAVEHGGFELAWIGMVDEERGIIRPVASAGQADGYLETSANSFADEPAGRGAAGKALRTGRFYVCRDMLLDPDMALWRAKAEQHGFRSVGAFPFQSSDGIPGAFTLYSSEIDFFQEDEIKLIQEIAMDISFALDALAKEKQRVQAENALLSEKNKSEAIIAAIGDGISIQGLDFKILYQNERHKMLIGDHVGEYCYAAYENRKENCEVCPLALSFKDGMVHGTERNTETLTGPLHVEITGSPLKDAGGKIIAGIEVVRNISERKQTEENLKQRNQFIETIMNNLSIGLAVNSVKNGKALYMNKKFEEIYGWPKDILADVEAFFANVYPDQEYRGQLRQKIMDDIASGDPSRMRWEQIRITTRTGDIKYVTAFNIPLFEQDLMISTVQDVTEYRYAGQALVKSEMRYRRLIESVTDYIYTVKIENAQSVLTNHGPGCLSVTGYTSEEFDSDPFLWFRIVHNEDKAPVMEYAANILAGRPVAPFEHRIVHKDGSIRWIKNTTVARFDSEGRLTGYDGLISNITPLKQLEDQLRQAQKMEAVGQLAGGIAHDFNNILTAIIGYGNLLLMKLPEHDTVRSYVEQILASSDRAAHLTHSLLAFSRKQIIDLKPVDINAVIRRVEKLLYRLIGEDIDLQASLAGGTLSVLADSVQIEQVLMNLATNARDAMPEGGLLMIETRTFELGEEFVRTHAYGKAGTYALITVTDTGHGMDEKVRSKIFEPFFTTKEVGKGTGLGLAMAYGIIKQHNGYLNVYSEPEKGTTFKLYLPLIAGQEQKRGINGASADCQGTETILLAEDDIEVRKLSKTVLEDFGYTVIEAGDGEEAIDKFRQNRDKINILVLDIIMPKKNGKEAYQEIKKEQPDIKALFTSGYTADIIHKKGILETGLEFVLKPISPTDFLKKVREVLDKGNAK